MKQFFKYVLATIVGIVALSILAFIAFFVMGTAIISSAESGTKTTVSANSILELDLNAAVKDRVNRETGFGSLFDDDGRLNDGLLMTTQAIRHAKDDKNIKGIYLDIDAVPTGFANLMELQEALEDFKESGKFIVSYSDFLTQGAYALAATADEVYVHPEGVMDFKGLSSNVTYLKGTLDKLDIEPMIFYAGDFKSATEPLRRTNMSENNRIQVTEFLNDIYDEYLKGIARNRNLSISELRVIADDYKVRKPDDAVTYKLIDGVKYDDEIETILKSKVNFDDDEKLNFVGLNEYVDAKNIKYSKSSASSKNKVAVVYAEGGIGMGDGDNNIQGTYYRKMLRKIRQNDKIKAVVLRVNSGGGSAFASDKIWREIELMKKEKPVVVSFGNVAASGGYYIACNADKIYAEPTTITGSIGVFATLFNMKEFMNNKLGMTTDQVKTGKFSDFPNMTRDWSEEEEAIAKEWVTDIYDDFVGKVADGRGMSKEAVHEIAQGRVWSGTDALENGLIDELGSIEDAIAHAAELAEIDGYKLSTYPRERTPWEELTEMFNVEAKADKMLKEKLGSNYRLIEMMEQLETYSEPQMRLPYEIEIK